MRVAGERLKPMKCLVSLVSILVLAASNVVLPSGGQILELLSHVGAHHSSEHRHSADFEGHHSHASEAGHQHHHHSRPAETSETKHHHAEIKVEFSAGKVRIVHRHGDDEGSHEPHEHQAGLSLSSHVYISNECHWQLAPGAIVKPEPLDAEVLFSSQHLDRLFRPPKA